MTWLVLDTESTTFQKGNPFARRNVLCCVGLLDSSGYTYFDIEHSGLPYGKFLSILKRRIEAAKIAIGFNIKYDLHWLKRYIPDLVTPQTIWDCQYGEFLLSNQTLPYPSLDGSLAKYGLPPKLNVVKTEYWDKGIDTTEIPSQILKEYNEQDCRGTYDLYQHQVPQFKGNLKTLFQLHCDDLKILQEMEFNGLNYDAAKSLSLGEGIQEELTGILHQLVQTVGPTPFDINWNSPKQLSALLYGGDIEYPVRETVPYMLKNGTPRTRERWGTATHRFERLYEPLPGSDLASGGWSTDEATLRSLSTTKQNALLIELILKVSELDKLRGTYYNGLPKLIQEMDWKDNTLHGTINQCVARTGRTSSSKPNLQNFDGRLKPLFYSRYNDSIGESSC